MIGYLWSWADPLCGWGRGLPPFTREGTSWSMTGEYVLQRSTFDDGISILEDADRKGVCLVRTRCRYRGLSDQPRADRMNGLV